MDAFLTAKGIRRPYVVVTGARYPYKQVDLLFKASVLDRAAPRSDARLELTASPPPAFRRWAMTPDCAARTWC